MKKIKPTPTPTSGKAYPIKEEKQNFLNSWTFVVGIIIVVPLIVSVFMSSMEKYSDRMKEQERTRSLRIQYGEVFLVKDRFYGVGECVATKYNHWGNLENSSVEGDCTFSSGAVVEDYTVGESYVVRKKK